jgi:aspartyl-tRNA synthetase
MSFVDREDVMSTLEALYTEIFKQFGRKPLAKTPVPRMTYEEAIRRYGIDRPDMRFAMELVDLTDALRGTGFNAFRSVIDAGGAVRGVLVPGKADATRKEIDGWQAIAKTKGAKGLASFAFAGAEIRSPVAKFLTPAELDGIRARPRGHDEALRHVDHGLPARRTDARRRVDVHPQSILCPADTSRSRIAGYGAREGLVQAI